MSQREPSFIGWRYYLILGFVFIAVLGLCARIVDLTILKQHFLRQQGDQRELRLVSTPAFRGMILDRNGFPLAVSTTVYSVWVNPTEWLSATPPVTQAARQKLANLLRMTVAEINRLIAHNTKREFVYLKRALSPSEAQSVKALHLPGIYLQQAYRRYYPEGEVAAQVIGFTNIDDQGQEGLELAYNDWLVGVPGQKWVIKDRLGSTIADVQTVSDEKPGRDLILSIDRRIQYLAYSALAEGLHENHASSGTAIVLDAKTGEILAMVNQPSFNPNHRTGKDQNYFRNRAVTDTYEPGSVIKAFTVASGLESGRFRPNSLINTSPGLMRIGNSLTRDEKDNGTLSLAQILQYSSDVGAAKIALALPPNQLWEVLHQAGFGEITGVGFPGEQSGSLVKRNNWGLAILATLSRGYGLSVTAIQVAEAYSILANEGIKKPIYLLRQSHLSPGERVLRRDTAEAVLQMLESVFAKGGTGARIQIPGYRLAGKSGTAWVVGDKGYEKHRYTSSFVGIAPLSYPRLIVAVVIHDPQGKNYLGGVVSGPIFAKIMEGSLRILNIPPDQPMISQNQTSALSK